MKANKTITKVAITLVSGLLGLCALTAQADTLVATQNTTSCVWTQTGSYGGSGGAQINYTVTCPNDTFQASKIITGTNPQNCQLQVSSPYYATGVSGTTCGVYSIYKTGQSSSSSSSVSACAASGKAGKYVATGYSSGVVQVAQQAAQYCAPCGTTNQSVANGGYAFYCSAQ